MLALPFTVIKGHQVASGLAKDSPFSRGTIELQAPYFRALGLDLSPYFAATINAQFRCRKIDLISWDYKFENVNWAENVPSESFCFAHAKVMAGNRLYDALIYQPVKETKVGHQQAENVLEILAAKIENLNYGCEYQLFIENSKVRLAK